MKENLTTVPDEISPENDESVSTNVVDEEQRNADRLIVRNATISSWLKKIDNGEEVSLAPEWVQKEIRSKIKKEDIVLDDEHEIGDFKKVLDETREMSGLDDEKFYNRYGNDLRNEIDTLIEYGLPPKIALKKAISIIGVRSEGDRRREEQRNIGVLPQRSSVLPSGDEFYLVPVREFDSFSESKKKLYMKECESRFGEVIFV